MAYQVHLRIIKESVNAHIITPGWAKLEYIIYNNNFGKRASVTIS